jgi:hypothetical protein
VDASLLNTLDRFVVRLRMVWVSLFQRVGELALDALLLGLRPPLVPQCLPVGMIETLDIPD